jgi:hypothetical protein
VIIAGILVRLVILGSLWLSIALEDTGKEEVISRVTDLLLGVLVSIIPLFMYSSYVRLSIIQLIEK